LASSVDAIEVDPFLFYYQRSFGYLAENGADILAEEADEEQLYRSEKEMAD
jgi:hypothetical protein